MEKLELQKIANEVRKDIVTAVHAAKAGHPGGSLSAADLFTYLYFQEMNIDPKDPKKADRDRFVLSKGHTAPGLYSALAERGYFPKEDLKTLRHLGSYLQGHPDMKHIPGVDMTSGSLGQGISAAVGMALSAKLSDESYRVYTLLGDGEIQEGQVWEAAMFAGFRKLDNLVVIVDNNGLQIDGKVDEVCSPYPIDKKFEAFNFHVINIADGNDMDQLKAAFDEAKATKGMPTAIIMKTVKGKGVSFMENQAGWHGKAPNDEQYAQAISVSLRKEELDLWLDAFDAEGLFPSLVTVDPFPLLINLPSRQHGIALFLHVQRECSTVALLDNGTIRRIRAIPVGWMPETDAAGLNSPSSERENAALCGFAARLRRETSLVLEGTPFVPDRLLAYGEAFLGNGASARFAEAFGLPVSVLGQEIPLGGQVARLGETDPSRLLALCVAAMPLPAPWRPPLIPSFHRPPRGGHLSSEHGRRLAWAACGALAVGAACLASVWAEGYAAGQQALRHEDAARALFRKALPDVRGSFNPVQMESILKNRIAGLRGGGENDATFPALHLLQDMHAAVPGSLDIRLDRLSLDARRCGFGGTAAGYEQVNALRVALSGLPGVREAKILSAANRTGKPEPGTPPGAVIFEIELALEGGQP